MDTEIKNDGVIPMVKIDGTIVRKLREEKGLTQLYLATAVDVTTDTISRWENRRYPTIKRENGVRLAESLGVELIEILETEDEQNISEKQSLYSSDGQTRPYRMRVLQYFLLGFFLLVIVFVGIRFWLLPEQEKEFLIASRILPARSAAGQTFPVIIELFCKDNESLSVIVKEALPPGSIISQTYPPVTTTDRLGHELKWLQKFNGRTRFTYLVKVKPGSEKTVHFLGTVAVTMGNVVPVQGDKQVLIDHSHWADSDGDAMISDTEILHVYDQFSEIEGLDIERIERMWTGSGYRWNPDKESFEVLE